MPAWIEKAGWVEVAWGPSGLESHRTPHSPDLAPGPVAIWIYINVEAIKLQSYFTNPYKIKIKRSVLFNCCCTQTDILWYLKNLISMTNGYISYLQKDIMGQKFINQSNTYIGHFLIKCIKILRKKGRV